jgi:hypothetical protein
MPTGSSFTVAMINVLSLPDDPGNLYTAQTPGSNPPPVASISVLSTDNPSARLYSAGFSPASTNPNGLQAMYVLYANYGSAAGQGTITMAVDVVLRDS